MLGENVLHKQILGEKPEPTVEDKYGVHFQYRDLCSRLMEVKVEREKKIRKTKSIPKFKASLVVNTNPDVLTERTNYTINTVKNRRTLSGTKSKPVLKEKTVKKSASPYKNDQMKTKILLVNENKKRVVKRNKSGIENKMMETLNLTKKVSLTKISRPSVLKKLKTQNGDKIK